MQGCTKNASDTDKRKHTQLQPGLSVDKFNVTYYIIQLLIQTHACIHTQTHNVKTVGLKKRFATEKGFQGSFKRTDRGSMMERSSVCSG